MTMQKNMLSEKCLRRSEEGLVFSFRLPWYRSLPLSVIEPAELTINGKSIDLSRVDVRINGETIALSELASKTECSWFVLDPMEILLGGESQEKGDFVDLEFVLNVYPPYIPGMCWATRAESTYQIQ